MRKFGLFVCGVLIAAVLAGCAAENAAGKDALLSDGRYVPEGADETSEVSVPYVLINGGRFSYIADIAVSYQPGGKWKNEDGYAVMRAKFADEDYVFVFKVADGETIVFDAGRSSVPDAHFAPANGTVFRRDKDN